MASITTGYNDWTDLPSYDGDLDVSETSVVHASGGMSGLILNVQNWASVGVAITPIAGPPIIYQATYTADAVGSITVGTIQWAVDPSAQVASAGFLPNLGPYMAISASTVGAVSFTHSFYQWRSQRLPQPRWVPQTPYLFNQGNTNIGAGATNTQFGQYLYGGPVQYRWGTAGQVGSFTIASLNNGGTYTSTSDGVSMAANSNGRGQLILPEGTHRLQITNNGAGAAIFSVNIWPSITGSS